MATICGYGRIGDHLDCVDPTIEDERGFGLHKGKSHQAVLAVFPRASIACVCLYMYVYMYTLPLVTKEVDPDVCSCSKLM